MNKFVFFLCLSFCIAINCQSKQQIINIGDLHLESGRILKDCSVGFRTFGFPNADSSNFVIIPSWFGGSSEASTALLGTGKFLDSTKYYIITLDALGNGVSSSPSNFCKEKESVFPEISILDMINSQYILITKHLGIKKVFAVLGGSMGGMQALQWAVSYPEFSKKIIAYVPAPRRSSFDQLTMRFNLRMIEELRKNNTDEKTIEKLINYTDEIFIRTPEYINKNINPDKVEEYLNGVENRARGKMFTVDNYVSQLKALVSHNIYKYCNNSVEETVARIKAEILFIVGERDILVHPSETIKFAEKLKAGIIKLDNDCGHLAPGCDLKRCSDEIKKFLAD